MTIVNYCPIPENFCADKPDGMYADPNDCTKFYQCAAGEDFHQQCSPPTIFDPYHKICNWADQVDRTYVCINCPEHLPAGTCTTKTGKLSKKAQLGKMADGINHPLKRHYDKN